MKIKNCILLHLTILKVIGLFPYRWCFISPNQIRFKKSRHRPVLSFLFYIFAVCYYNFSYEYMTKINNLEVVSNTVSITLFIAQYMFILTYVFTSLFILLKNETLVKTISNFSFVIFKETQFPFRKEKLFMMSGIQILIMISFLIKMAFDNAHSFKQLICFITVGFFHWIPFFMSVLYVNLVYSISLSIGLNWKLGLKRYSKIREIKRFFSNVQLKGSTKIRYPIFDFHEEVSQKLNFASIKVCLLNKFQVKFNDAIILPLSTIILIFMTWMIYFMFYFLGVKEDLTPQINNVNSIILFCVTLILCCIASSHTTDEVSLIHFL